MFPGGDRAAPQADDAQGAEAEAGAEAAGAIGSGRPAREHIPAEVERAVWARDGAGGCAFVGPDGKRCGSRHMLARSITSSRWRWAASRRSPTVSLVCAVHNQHLARQVFGEEWMAQFTRRARSIDNAARNQTVGLQFRWRNRTARNRDLRPPAARAAREGDAGSRAASRRRRDMSRPGRALLAVLLALASGCGRGSAVTISERIGALDADLAARLAPREGGFVEEGGWLTSPGWRSARSGPFAHVGRGCRSRAMRRSRSGWGRARRCACG